MRRTADKPFRFFGVGKRFFEQSYPYTDDAKRAAEKYIDVSEKMYEKTGVMWEKYNVLTGDSNTAADYKSREMLGWSAGVYLYAKQYAERKQ